MPTPSLSVDPTGEETDLFVRLYNVAPGGTSTPIKDQQHAVSVEYGGPIDEKMLTTQGFSDAGHALRVVFAI